LDATFEAGNKRFVAEFKIAYQGNTRRAIREALGQILEYNHYPPRITYDHWLLILDKQPSTEDIAFVLALAQTYRLPLALGWKTYDGFDFVPSFIAINAGVRPH
jgi:hypothetical protein